MNFLHLSKDFSSFSNLTWISNSILLLFSCLLVEHQCNITSITVVYLRVPAGRSDEWRERAEQDSREPRLRFSPPPDLQGTKQAWSGLNKIHSSQAELMYRYVSGLLCGFSVKMKKTVVVFSEINCLNGCAPVGCLWIRVVGFFCSREISG